MKFIHHSFYSPILLNSQVSFLQKKSGPECSCTTLYNYTYYTTPSNYFLTKLFCGFLKSIHYTLWVADLYALHVWISIPYLLQPVGCWPVLVASSGFWSVFGTGYNRWVAGLTNISTISAEILNEIVRRPADSGHHSHGPANQTRDTQILGY